MPRPRKPWLRFRRVALAFLLATLGGVLALHLTPFPASLLATPGRSTEFLDRHGAPLRTLLVDQRRYARHCTLADISPHLINATLSAEDRRFRSHPGIDPVAVLRALGSALRNGQPTSGASSLTQQLVKLSRPAKPRTLANKLAELWLALRVERTWDKDRILSEYLNRLDYGNLQIGIASASLYYFDKPATDLSPAESALLAGLPRAPSRLDPQTNPTGVIERQRWVLHRMRANGVLDRASLERALAEPVRVRPHIHDFEAPHFVDLLLMRKGLLPVQGGPVRTTLDLELNRFAETCLTENLQRLTDKQASGAAAVVLDNATGEVLAMAGSGNYFQAGAGQINGAWMVRSPGSAMKPFTYLLALQKGCQPCTLVPDVPTEFSTSTGLYRPNNYNHRFYGPVSLRFALGNSLNVAAVRTLELAGGPAALHAAMRQAGITTFGHPAEYYGLGLTLGNGEVRLLELANAYATLARLGEYRPYRLLMRDGESTTPTRQVFDRDAAYLLADMLADNSARAASFGLNSFLRFDFPVACKTGTSSDYRDNWTMGFTREFTVGVWVGNPDGKPMQGITGVTGAAPILHELLVYLHERFGTSWFKPPERVQAYNVDPLTGRLAPPGSAGAVLERCLASPAPSLASDYDPSGRVRLPAVYKEWLASAQNTLGSLAIPADSGTSLEILRPKPGTVYYLDPDLPRESQWIALKTGADPGAAANLQWECPSARVAAGPHGARCRLSEGRHTITVTDPSSGRQASTWIVVESW